MSKFIVYLMNGQSIEIEADRVSPPSIELINGVCVDCKYLEFYKMYTSRKLIAQFSTSSIAGWERNEDNG